MQMKRGFPSWSGVLEGLEGQIANLWLHILPNLDLYMIVDGAFQSKITFYPWTQQRLPQKSVCWGRGWVRSWVEPVRKLRVPDKEFQEY